MVEAFQNVVMRLAMCGLGVSLAAMALRSRPVRDAFARMLAIWRGLTAFGRFAVCSFLLVGILVADALRRHGVEDVPLTLVDSHSRAIAAARQNVAALGLDADCLLADDGLPPEHPGRGKFKIALANPPYYGEGRIADLFAEIAATSLAPDGVCWMVAKTPAIIQAACGKCFRAITAIKRRGYTVLRASFMV